MDHHDPVDALHMRRCLDLARRAEGATSPNPMVGAVLARGRRVIAEAFHRRAGGPHAELSALRRAGRAARGATLYVNLEPCCHYGRTPPCVDAILQSGVRRVVAALRDPFPRVNGRGLAALRRAGVTVQTGCLSREAALLNERYLIWVTRRRPFVLVKAAMTLDGKIATASGESRWITSAASRAEAHRLRAIHDAVLIGVGTALADDPRLSARAGRTIRQPARVILDSRLRLPVRSRLLRDDGGRVLIYATPRAPRDRQRALERRGAVVVRVRAGAGGRADLRATLADLARRGVTSVLIEGGSALIGAAFESKVVDRVALFAAPLILGGAKAIPVVGGRGAARLRSGVRLTGLAARRIGPDLLLEGRVAAGTGRI